jgi:hypothetical protein
MIARAKIQRGPIRGITQHATTNAAPNPFEHYFEDGGEWNVGQRVSFKVEDRSRELGVGKSKVRSSEVRDKRSEIGNQLRRRPTRGFGGPSGTAFVALASPENSGAQAAPPSFDES